MIRKLLIYLAFSIFFPLVLAGGQPLPPEQAFQLETHSPSPGQFVAEWHIKPGYYLYRDRFIFQLIPQQSFLKPTHFPLGIEKHNALLGQHTVYADQLRLVLNIPLTVAQYAIQVTYQGCADSGFCYPPITKIFDLTNPAIVSNTNTWDTLKQVYQALTHPTLAHSLLQQYHAGLVLTLFLIFGILLSFTPCVLPMVPIVSHIVLRNAAHTVSARQNFFLILIYVLSMALTYAVLGVMVSAIGINLSAVLQIPVVLIFSALLFVLLALSLFDWYQLALPTRFQNFLNRHIHAQQRTGYLGVALLGFFSSLILSPCITAPLLGALAYIAQSGRLWLGGSALFLLGFGMGVPLLLFGVAGKNLLPKPGPWMENVKHLLGILLFAVAVSLIERVLPNTASNIIWGGFFFSAALLLYYRPANLPVSRHLFEKILIIIFLSASVWLFSQNILLVQHVSGGTHTTNTTVTRIESLEEMRAYAKNTHKPLLLDFYADWCVSCKIVEKITLQNPTVQTALKHWVFVTVDITRTRDPAVQQMMRQYQIIAPPTFVFFNRNGQEKTGSRIVGEISPSDLSHTLDSIAKE